MIWLSLSIKEENFLVLSSFLYEKSFSTLSKFSYVKPVASNELAETIEFMGLSGTLSSSGGFLRASSSLIFKFLIWEHNDSSIIFFYLTSSIKNLFSK